MLAVRILTSGPSDGAKRLSDALTGVGVRSSRVTNKTPNVNKVVKKATIKWGCFDAVERFRNASTVMLNHGADLRVLNKLRCLREMKKCDLPVVEFTIDHNEARAWLHEGERVYCRSTLTGSGGEGITVLTTPSSQVPDVRLYTKGVKGKRREYRIHVYNHNGVTRYWVQQKKRRQGFEENDRYDNLVRNLDHGWIFAHNDITPPKEHTIGAAVGACNAFGLNFGAVDVIETDKGGQPYILEINTAPGLEGATVDFYANCIKDSLNG